MLEPLDSSSLSNMVPATFHDATPPTGHTIPLISAIGEKDDTHSERPHYATVGASSSCIGSQVTFMNEQDTHFKPKVFLGAGSYGSVYGGSFGMDQQDMALKLLTRDPMKKDQSFEREIAALQHLRHPCIVRLHAVAITKFNVQLFFQWHESSLHKYLQHKPIEAHAKQVALSILRGLAFMHGKGYIHRDVKPGNILVESQPLTAIIADLGSAHLGEDSRGKWATITSRAPENMLHHPYTKASDVWGLGCTLAELEQRRFFEELMPGRRTQTRQMEEYSFMSGLASKLCPQGVSTLSAMRSLGSLHDGLGKGVLNLGPVAPGVVGVRFNSHAFHSFMARILHFQRQARATAEDLLTDPWLQL